MTVNFRKFGVLASVFLLGSIPGQSHAQMGSLVVKVDQPGVKISSTFNGLMIEDINHSIDGGLYAELIQNRVFRDNPDNPVHWSLVQTGEGAGTIGLDSSQPVPGTVLTSSLRIEVSKSRVGSRVGVANDGYWGIPCLPGERYRATFYAKAAPGFIGPLTLSLESADGLHVWASSQSPAPGLGWKQYSVILKTKKDAPISATNRFVISTNSPGTIWLTQVSLMPQTYHNRPNGTRVDLMQKLAGIQPKFLRFPGGNYLEGDTIVDRFDWKKMIGDIAQRPGHPDSWGYRSNDGFGLLEYLEWCEDLQMQPVVGIYAGFSLDRKHVPPGPDLAPYVQDALDEIEYITGDVHSKWGARRIADGHLAPFPLTYVEIGNEAIRVATPNFTTRSRRNIQNFR